MEAAGLMASKGVRMGEKVRYVLGYATALFGGLLGLGAVSGVAFTLLEEGFGAALRVLPSSAMLGVLAVGLYQLGIRISFWSPRRSRNKVPVAMPTNHVEIRTPQAKSELEHASVIKDIDMPAAENADSLVGLSTGSDVKKSYGGSGKIEATSDSFAPESASVPTTTLAFPALMSGQLVARYKQTHYQTYHDEYLRRLRHLGFEAAEAEGLFLFELMILKHDAIERLADESYLAKAYFDLRHVALPESDDYYISHQTFLVSEIVKIWDEAEWHYWHSHEKDLSEDVWAEIYRISRYGGGKLFLGYLQMVAEKANVPFEKVQAYSAAEQNLIFKYKWNAGKSEPHPYQA